MDYTLAIFIVAVIFVAGYIIERLWDRIPDNGDWYELVRFADYAVNAAKTATGSTDARELGDKAAEYLKKKFPKIKDVDIEVAIGQALEKLEKPRSVGFAE